MKTTLKTVTAALLIATFFINTATAQEMAATTVSNKTTVNNVMVESNNTTTSDDAATNVNSTGNSRLAAKFISRFPAAQQQQWAVTNKGYWVSFLNEGRKTRAGFNTNGQLNYMVEDCNKDQLSGEFQSFIAKNYAGYQFLSAICINAFGEQNQQAILENNTGFVTLNFNDEGVEETRKISKAK